jgi:hypothetical protein
VRIADAVPVALDLRGRFHGESLLPAALAGATLYLQAFDPAACRSSNLVIQTIP